MLSYCIVNTMGDAAAAAAAAVDPARCELLASCSTKLRLALVPQGFVIYKRIQIMCTLSRGCTTIICVITTALCT